MVLSNPCLIAGCKLIYSLVWIYTLTISLGGKKTHIVKFYSGFHCRKKTCCFLTGFAVICMVLLEHVEIMIINGR